MRALPVLLLLVCCPALLGPGMSARPAAAATLVARPLSPYLVVRPFEPPPHPWSPGHRGVDLLAGAGAPVRSPVDGVVTFSGWVVDRHVLTVRDGTGLRHSFEPVQEGLPSGTPVRRGQPLARVAPGGHCPVGCLHWGVRRDQHYLDPSALLVRPRPVLLPHLAGVRGSTATVRASSPGHMSWSTAREPTSTSSTPPTTLTTR